MKSLNILCSTAALGMFAFGVATTTFPSASYADDDDRQEAIEKAESECRDAVQEEGFDDIELGDANPEDDGDKFYFPVKAERDGENRSFRCVYDRDSEQASLDD